MAKKKVIKLTKTDIIYRYKNCSHCNGTGIIPITTTDNNWYIDYHYQDGHELSKPMSKKDAIKDMNEDDFGCVRRNKTLIGPDGYIYTIE